MRLRIFLYARAMAAVFCIGLLPGLTACGGNKTSNPAAPRPEGPSGSGSESGSQNGNRTIGYGVSGLLFNNNLIMYDRVRSDKDNFDLVLVPQMYFTSIDVSGFPVYGSFPRNQIVSGGPKIDDIPAITDPVMVGPDEVGFMSDSDLVIGMTVNGETRAYPHNVLWWHEVINDDIGGQKVTVSLCPLTGTGLVFDASVARDRLEMMPSIEATWGRWKQMHPETRVVSGSNSNRPLTTYPYGNYRSDNTDPLFPVNRPLDTRFPNKRMVHGVLIDGLQKAYPFSSFASRDAVNDVVGGTPVLVVFDRAGQMALSYSRLVEGRTLTFSVVDGGVPFRLKDDQTGTTWTVEGRAVEGEMAGASLTRIKEAYNAFWFAWAVFWPNTQVYSP